MPTVWTERAGSMSSAPSIPSRPSSPRRRARREVASSAEASTSPLRSSQAISDVEPDLQHVAVLHLVVLALDAKLALLLGRLPRAEGEELVPADHLGADEPALQVGVDDAGALRCLGAGAERPRPALLVAGGEERPPAEHGVGGLRHAGQGALAEAEPFQQLGALGRGELGGFGLEL